MPLRALRSGFQNICGDGFKHLLRERKSDGIVGFSLWKGQLPLAERDVIECDPADLNRSQAQEVGQVNDRIGSDIPTGREFEGGKEFLDFPGSQKLGRFIPGKLARAYKQRGEVFLDDPSFMIQIPQEAAKVRAVNPDSGLLYLESRHKGVKVINLQVGKSDLIPFEILMEKDQKPSDPSTGVLRSL